MMILAVDWYWRCWNDFDLVPLLPGVEEEDVAYGGNASVKEVREPFVGLNLKRMRDQEC